MLSSPLVVLGLVLATLYSSVYHFLYGESMRQLVVLWVAAMVGFGLGQALASSLGLPDLKVGSLHLAASSVSCWLTMLLVRRLEL